MTLAVYLYLAMSTWIAPTHKDVDRYVSISEDIAAVADESPVFAGEDGPARTGLLLASIASFESGYRADIDDLTVKGDHGASASILQIWVRPGEHPTDRRSFIRLGVERIKESFGACRGSVLADRLALYASGHCDAGLRESRHRVERALRYWKASPFVLGRT